MTEIDIMAADILVTVCAEYVVSINDLLSKKRNKELNLPRQIVMYLCRELTDMSLGEIGRTVGNRNYITARSAVAYIEHRMVKDEQFSEKVYSLIETLCDGQ